MKKIIALGILFSALTIINACSIADEFSSGNTKEITWTTFEKVATKKNKTKKVMVDMYTNWCGWCKRMDKSTFQDPKIIKYINKNFYPVRFNAEERKAIEFNSKTYVFDASITSRGRHQLASELLQTNDKVGYPTIVFMDENMNVIQAVQGYKDSEEFEIMMTYFGEDHYKNTPWLEYRRNYKPM